jgi:hypothetical protein
MFQNGPAAADPTPELEARYAELKAEWDEHVGGKLIPPRSWRLDTCDKCHSGGEYHREHATEQELADHEAALEWIRERAGGSRPQEGRTEPEWRMLQRRADDALHRDGCTCSTSRAARRRSRSPTGRRARSAKRTSRQTACTATRSRERGMTVGRSG